MKLDSFTLPILPVSSRTQLIINSSTPPRQDALQLVQPCSRQTQVLPGSETPTLIESLCNERAPARTLANKVKKVAADIKYHCKSINEKRGEFKRICFLYGETKHCIEIACNHIFKHDGTNQSSRSGSGSSTTTDLIIVLI